MSVVEQERTQEQTTIRIPASPEDEAIMRMIEMVRDKKWCRNYRDDDNGHHCALGMASLVSDHRLY